MQKLTGLERILKTVKLQEPDRVPHFELLIDKKVRDVILPDASYADSIGWPRSVVVKWIIPPLGEKVQRRESSHCSLY